MRHTAPRRRPAITLLQDWSRGSAAALEDLLQHLAPWPRSRVRRKISLQVRGVRGSEDIVRDVVLKLVERPPARAPQNERQFKGLVAKVIDNHLIDLDRRAAASPCDAGRVLRLPDAASEVLAVAPSADCPHRALETREQYALLKQALRRLDREDRRILMLHQVEGMTFPELGDLLGITKDAARMRFYAARDRLRALYPNDDRD